MRFNPPLIVVLANPLVSHKMMMSTRFPTLLDSSGHDMTEFLKAVQIYFKSDRTSIWWAKGVVIACQVSLDHLQWTLLVTRWEKCLLDKLNRIGTGNSRSSTTHLVKIGYQHYQSICYPKHFWQWNIIYGNIQLLMVHQVYY